MFWIKKTNFKQKDGYLYLRETIYERDKRTHIKKAKKLGSGKATSQRGKYSKKKDIYCGKVYEFEIKKYLHFKDYIESKAIDFLEYKINTPFDDILNDFVEYLLDIHNLNVPEFNNGKKKAYLIANGFLSKETLDWIRRFTIMGNPENSKEIERFAIRCKDSAIFDEEIIMTLYCKLIPEMILEEIQDERMPQIKEKEFSNMMDFMREQHKK
ncbi:MAG: hypothetical protein KC589_09085 [Nanoarchaeota archaeon]|nr:hypothetical protein [Nanoarchaeota archaeon]